MSRTAPTLDFERSLLSSGHRFVAGCDEVGRGALAGPVSVGMVVIDLRSVTLLAGVRDSKLLSVADRISLVPHIRRWALGYGVGHADATEIDAHGLIAALRLAGARAWHAVRTRQVLPDVVLLDGNHNWLSAPRQDALFAGIEAAGPDDGGCDAPVLTKIKADLQCLSVAAASVLAKVERDTMMTAFALEHPGYGWEANKGYATALHREAIIARGPAPLHRTSWRLTGKEPSSGRRAGKVPAGSASGADGLLHVAGGG